MATIKSTIPNLILDTADSNIVFTTTLNGDVLQNTGTIGNVDANRLETIPVSPTTPITGQFLGFDGTEWIPTTVTSPIPNGAYGIPGSNGSYAVNLSVNSSLGTGNRLKNKLFFYWSIKLLFIRLNENDNNQVTSYIAQFTFPSGADFVLEIQATGFASNASTSTYFIVLSNGTTITTFSQQRFSTNSTLVNYPILSTSSTTVNVLHQKSSSGIATPVTWNVKGNYVSPTNSTLGSLAINLTPTAT